MVDAGRYCIPSADAAHSVFDLTPFIAEADLSVPPECIPVWLWQSAAGRRRLTPPEQAARELYFQRKAVAALYRARHHNRPAA